MLHRVEDGDSALATDLLKHVAAGAVDYTVFFRALSEAAGDPTADVRFVSLFADAPAFEAWLKAWRLRVAREGADARAGAMRAVNPAFTPRNHRVAEAIVAGSAEDFAPFETLVRVLERPYDDQPAVAHLAEPPRPEDRVRKTFCGT